MGFTILFDDIIFYLFQNFAAKLSFQCLEWTVINWYWSMEYVYKLSSCEVDSRLLIITIIEGGILGSRAG